MNVEHIIDTFIQISIRKPVLSVFLRPNLSSESSVVPLSVSVDVYYSFRCLMGQFSPPLIPRERCLISEQTAQNPVCTFIDLYCPPEGRRSNSEGQRWEEFLKMLLL